MRMYRKRIADRILHDKLEAKGAVLIEGPKWCEKPQQQLKLPKALFLYRILPKKVNI
jgi:hypothetical protein